MLTQLQITAAKPKAEPYTLADGQGLALFVQPSGAKLWRFRYRYGGTAKTLHIGPWPNVSLADARRNVARLERQSPLGTTLSLRRSGQRSPRSSPWQQASRKSR